LVGQVLDPRRRRLDHVVAEVQVELARPVGHRIPALRNERDEVQC
jgi:hypothetical protein